VSRQPRRVRAKAVLATIAAALMVTGLFVGVQATVGPVEPAQAANAADFDPGYIIDDKVFYDSTGYTAGEVQAFLNSQVRTCKAGAVCLKDYAAATESKAADRYCAAYQGQAYETAAQMIDKVARACNINQRVLLVMLQKEQGLITSTAPSKWNYDAAMGQSCPDNAPCDPRFSGFFYQIYYGARQLQVYRLNPNLFGYREQRWNNILYHPEASRGCGTQSVFIHNQATAALYIYTPYVPNAAAMANLYGVGDGCSSYGNRNFWRLFTDWFGNPVAYSTHPGFVDYYEQRGGANGYIGRPTGYPVYVEANGQGWYQRFAGGMLYGSYWGGTVFVANNAILAEYNRHGGPAGSLAWPNAEQSCAAGLRCSQSFVYATISTTPQYGAHVIPGGMNTHWQATGGTNGTLGAALNDLSYSVNGAGPGWVQNFERGVMVQSQYGFVLVPYGAIQSVWTNSNAGAGPLGWPRTDVACASGDCAQLYSGGLVTSTPTWGAHMIADTFAREWESRGGLTGLGVAFNSASSSGVSGGGTIQNFAAGLLTKGTAGTFFVPYGRTQAVWTATGGITGTLGWPESAYTCDATGCGQQFQGGAVTESSWGVYSTFGGLGAIWRQGGGMAAYGPALNNIRYSTSNGGGWVQHFGNGVITQKQSGAAVFTPYGPILSTWYQYGAEATWLGWPLEAQTCEAGSCIQQFQNGVARSTPEGVVSFLPF